MALRTLFIGLGLTLTLLIADVQASFRSYDDISTQSPNKRYRVEAKSPDNADGKRSFFQSRFVYTCFDTMTKNVLWTRKQPTEESIAAAKAAKTDAVRFEVSPSDVFVSDTGWTLIRTGNDELIAVDPSGKEPWRMGLLEKAFKKDELERYVHGTSVGPMWSSYSLWYFLENGSKRLFVIRPWWGHRIILDVDNGKPVAATEEFAKRADAHERDYVSRELKQIVATRACYALLIPMLDISSPRKASQCQFLSVSASRS